MAAEQGSGVHYLVPRVIEPLPLEKRGEAIAHWERFHLREDSFAFYDFEELMATLIRAQGGQGTAKLEDYLHDLRSTPFNDPVTGMAVQAHHFRMPAQEDRMYEHHSLTTAPEWYFLPRVEERREAERAQTQMYTVESLIWGMEPPKLRRTVYIPRSIEIPTVTSVLQRREVPLYDRDIDLSENSFLLYNSAVRAMCVNVVDSYKRFLGQQR